MSRTPHPQVKKRRLVGIMPLNLRTNEITESAFDTGVLVEVCAKPGCFPLPLFLPLLRRHQLINLLSIVLPKNLCLPVDLPTGLPAAKLSSQLSGSAEILGCFRKNMSNAQIASELCISEETVRIHVRNLMKKLPEDKRNNIPEWR